MNNNPLDSQQATKPTVPEAVAGFTSHRPRSQSSAVSHLSSSILPASVSLVPPTVEASLVNATGRTRARSRDSASLTPLATGPESSGATTMDYFSTPFSHSAVRTRASSSGRPLSHGGSNDSAMVREQVIRRPVSSMERNRSDVSTLPPILDRGEESTISPKPPRKSHAEPPSFPNQSFAALQTQIHPQARVSLYNSRSGAPVQGGLSPLMSYVTTQRDSSSSKALKSTTSFTPAQSPGFFYTQNPLSTEAFDDPSPYPSPYLHPTQLQPPRTVTNAERGVDFVSGRKCINHYEILDELGRGVHGKVKLARNLDNDELVAIKIVQRFSKKKRLGKNSSPEDKVKKEIAILKKVQHPSVVRMIEVIDDPDINKVYIVLEFCELKEIAWRHPGTTEIVILENRRLEKEAEGIVQTHEDILRTERLMEIAAQRRELVRQEALRLHHQRRKSISEHWSLEYAGDTDDEFDVPTPNAHGLRSFEGAYRSGNSPQSTSETPRAMPSSRKSKNFVQRTVSTSPLERRKLTENEADEWVQSSAAIEQNDQSRSLQQSAHDSDFSSSVAEALLRRGRKPSVTESETSQITEIMEEEVPEDARFVPTMTIPECRAAFRDALVGLSYLHYHGIIHRDIKPANLLRTKDHRVKISDFGVSYLGKPIREGVESAEASESEGMDAEEEAELAKTVGTPAFYAPELCSLDLMADTPQVTGKIDLWALGVTLYCLLFARTPFTAENEYALMKRIAEEKVFIPRHRLKALDTSPSSRSSSHGVRFRPAQDRRLPDQFVHEDIDDDLHDLLRKLFIKDPELRIGIQEVKHHPWVLKGIPNPSAWIDETDPARLGQGEKIQISKEEVADAVAPLKVIERLRSITGRAGRALGLGGRTNRKRAPTAGSTASSDAGSSSSARSAAQDSKIPESRRPSLRGDESLFAALKAAREREVEHPLSKSLTASPEVEETPHRSTEQLSLSRQIEYDETVHSTTVDRPSMPERHASEWSTAGSIRTLRPSDVERGRRGSPSQQTTNQTTTTPHSEERHHQLQTQPHETSVTSALGAIFGGAGRNFLRSVRSRDRYSASSTSPARSVAPSESEASTDFPSSEPSVALSNTSATGRINTPSALRTNSISYSSMSSSISSPKNISTEASSENLDGLSEKSYARESSVESGSRSRLMLNPSHLVAGDSNVNSPRYTGSPQYTPEMNDTQYDSAMNNLVRRRKLEDTLSNEQSNRMQKSSWYSEAECPPSPDDERKAANEASMSEEMSKEPTYMTLNPTQIPISPTSSENNNPTPVSQMTSPSSLETGVNASIESLSIQGDYTTDPTAVAISRMSASGGLVPPSIFHSGEIDEDAFQSGSVLEGAAVDSDNEASDTSDGDFLVMNRRKSTNQAGSRPATGSGLAPTTMRPFKGRRTSMSHAPKKSNRTGSTNTVKKVGSGS